MQIEKFISQQINSQFPGLYREDAQDLIEFVKAYYQFLEETSNQSIYNTRRMFEYRDIDQTLPSLLEFFKEKYLEDLDLDKIDTKFLIKNVLDLYRRRGSQEGLELFFKMFYDKKVSIYYPSKDILRPSSSTWQTGDFLQLYPADPTTFSDISNKLIIGSISKATAIVSSVQFSVINSTLTPIIFLNNIRGEFERLDEIYTTTDTGIKVYGTVYGSLNDTLVSLGSIDKSGNKVGDILTVESENGFGGKVRVSAVSSTFSGEVEYDLIDGGFGYTEEQSRLIASDQFIFTPNLSNSFVVLERVIDQANNVGTILGQTSVGIAIYSDPGMVFDENSVIYTLDREVNIEIPNQGVTFKNTTSPGVLYPDAVAANTDTTGTVQAQITNQQTFSLMEDEIGDFFAVQFDSVNYNLPPALNPMSGGLPVVDVDTILSDAFDEYSLQVGTLTGFINISPGNSYLGDVFGHARDPLIESLGLQNDILFFTVSTDPFVVGEEITQGGKTGKILAKDATSITVRTYAYEGMTAGPITYDSVVYTVDAVEKDGTSRDYGQNAIVNTFTTFAVGKIEGIKVINSGIGYYDGQLVALKAPNGETITERTVLLGGQGKKEGSWKTYESHLNSKNGKVLQDSFFYQDYSYQVSSDLNINTYTETLKNVAHPAGVKLFGRFVLNDEKKIDLTSEISIT